MPNFEKVVLPEINVETISKEIAAMAKADQDMRTESEFDLEKWDRELDKKHTNRLKEIIRMNG